MQALIIGAGNFGMTIATEMAAKKCEVVVIDNHAHKLDDIKDQVAQVIVGDATDKDLLAKFARNMDIVIVSLGEIIDASVLITHHLKELGVKRIIAKAASQDHGKILKIIGAHQVVFPERDEAIRLVQSLVAPDVLEVVRLSDDFNFVEVAVPKEFVSKSIQELDLRKKYGFQILAIKNPLTDTTKVMPPPDYKFQANDVMIILGDTSEMEELGKK